jgi:hypothetical protein
MLKLIRAYESSSFTAVSLSCCSKIFKVHKVVICKQPLFFNAACTKQFKVRGAISVISWVAVTPKPEK